MREADKVLGLLERKRTLFEAYEKSTAALLECDIDDTMEYHMATRERLIGEIDRLDDEMAALCEGNELWLAATRARCDFGDLPEEWTPVFREAARIISVAARVRELEPQVAERMERERDELQEKIRETNQSIAKHASRYYTGASAAGQAMRGPSFGKI